MNNKPQEKCIYPVVEHFIMGGIYGLCVGDAVGVPEEFTGRELLAAEPVTGMSGYGSHNQPPGTWSDDSSMALCLADSLGDLGTVNEKDIMDKFLQWLEHGAYTARGWCFDCGITVAGALQRYSHGTLVEKCGGDDLYSNGNGSLMRILPLGYELYFNYGEAIAQHDAAMDTIHRVSALTHRHPIAMSACGIYICIAVKLMAGNPLKTSIVEGVKQALSWYGRRPEFESALQCFERLREPEAFAKLPETKIRSGGYVVETLEAALWCLMNSSHYKECILKAVNLGFDTDTTAAVAGGLAGLAYGCEEMVGGVPGEWLSCLLGRGIIDGIIAKLRWRYGEKEQGFSLGTFNVQEAVGRFQKDFETKIFYEFLVPCRNRCTIIAEKWPQKEKPYCLDVSVDVKDTPNMLSCNVERFKTLEELIGYVKSRRGQKMIAAYIHRLIERM